MLHLYRGQGQTADPSLGMRWFRRRPGKLFFRFLMSVSPLISELCTLTPGGREASWSLDRCTPLNPKLTDALPNSLSQCQARGYGPRPPLYGIFRLHAGGGRHPPWAGRTALERKPDPPMHEAVARR